MNPPPETKGTNDMSEQSREKHWQLKAGRMASIANWALIELLNTIHGDGDTNAEDQANEYLYELRNSELLEFDEEDV